MDLVGKIGIPVAVKNYQDLPAKKSTAMQTSVQIFFNFILRRVQIMVLLSPGIL